MKKNIAFSRMSLMSYVINLGFIISMILMTPTIFFAQCDDLDCKDTSIAFEELPYTFSIADLLQVDCMSASFDSINLVTEWTIETHGLHEYNIYDLSGDQVCSGTVNFECILSCNPSKLVQLEIGEATIELLAGDFVFSTCYNDEVFAPPYENGIFTEGMHDVVILKPETGDTCYVPLTVKPDDCTEIDCENYVRKYYESNLFLYEILEDACPNSSQYLIEVYNSAGALVASGPSIFLDTNLDPELEIKVTHVESGNSCVSDLYLFHNCFDNTIDTLWLNYDDVDEITITWDSLSFYDCPDFDPTKMYMFYDDQFTSTLDDNGVFVFDKLTQDGKIILLDNRVSSFQSKEIILRNQNLQLLFGYVAIDSLGTCISEVMPTNGVGDILMYAASETDTIFDYTSPGGLFNLYIPENETYNLGLVQVNNFWNVCFPDNPVQLGESAKRADILLEPDSLCTYLTTSMSIPRFRRCFDNNVHIEYCNFGTDTAFNATLQLTFDEGLSINSDLFGLIEVNDNVFQLSIDTLLPLECKELMIPTFVDCDIDLSTTLCVEAEIGPIPDCNDNPEWSGASLDIIGICEGDSVKFTIKNTGLNDMNSVQEFIVIEDDIMIVNDMVSLDAGETLNLSYEANGSTYRVEASQEIFHPYTSFVSAVVDGCVDGNSEISTGFVNLFPLDEEAPFISIECHQVIGSFDPNDKTVTPSGAYENNIITGNERLEYMIRFENTGTDTAFKVVVRDTLDQNLDLTSWSLVGSSHPVEVDFPIDGILNFTFNNIALPDTSVNKSQANGFVKYAIKAKPNRTIETKVYNTASIYFDFNLPIQTNTVDLQIGEYQSTSTIDHSILVHNFIAPNPSSGSLNINTDHDYMVVTEINGNHVFKSRNKERYDLSQLSAGFYLVTIYSKELKIGINKWIKI